MYPVDPDAAGPALRADHDPDCAEWSVSELDRPPLGQVKVEDAAARYAYRSLAERWNQIIAAQSRPATMYDFLRFVLEAKAVLDADASQEKRS
jgi:hypothetical protein